MAAISPAKLEAPPWLYARLSRGAIFQRVYRRQVADLAALLPPGTRLLDVGTGPGYLLDLLAVRRQDLQVFGLDLSYQMLYYGQQMMAASRGQRPLPLLAGAVEALPFPGGVFQGVLAGMSLHHWTDPGRGVAEVFRVLKPGGRAWIYELNREAPRAALRRFAREERFPFLLVFLVVKSLGWGHALGEKDFTLIFQEAGISSWQLQPAHHLFWRAEFRKS